MKYHISRDGTPGICTAKGPCPLGGEDNHFDTYQEAREFGQQQLEKEYGLLSKKAEEVEPYQYETPLADENTKESTKLKIEHNEVRRFLQLGKTGLQDYHRALSKEASDHESKELRAIRKQIRTDKPNLSNYDVNKEAKSIYNKTDKAKEYKKDVRIARNDVFEYDRVKDNPEYLDTLREQVAIAEAKEERQELLSKEAEGSKVVLRDGDLHLTHNYLGNTVGDNHKIDGELTVDDEGNINNLYLVSNNGNVDKIIKVNEEGYNFTLDDGRETTLNHTSTSRGGLSVRQNYNIQVGEPSGEPYEGFKEVYVVEVDTSD